MVLRYLWHAWLCEASHRNRHHLDTPALGSSQQPPLKHSPMCRRVWATRSPQGLPPPQSACSAANATAVNNTCQRVRGLTYHMQGQRWADRKTCVITTELSVENGLAFSGYEWELSAKKHIGVFSGESQLKMDGRKVHWPYYTCTFPFISKQHMM